MKGKNVLYNFHIENTDEKFIFCTKSETEDRSLPFPFDLS
jgi:hypothetical protein